MSYEEKKQEQTSRERPSATEVDVRTHPHPGDECYQSESPECAPDDHEEGMFDCRAVQEGGCLCSHIRDIVAFRRDHASSKNPEKLCFEANKAEAKRRGWHIKCLTFPHPR